LRCFVSFVALRSAKVRRRVAKRQLPLGEGTDYHARQAWSSPRYLFAPCDGPKRERHAPRTTGEHAMLTDSALMLAEVVEVEVGSTVSPLMLLIYSLFYVLILVAWLAGMWKTFQKAGREGWEGIIPIYNYFIATQIAGRPILWFFLMLIPCVGVVIQIIVMVDFAARFGKSAGFGVGLTLLPFIFFPILGFGDARYQGGGTRY
jgi:uncharacterized membrane protein YhaH (DUF805 family)